MLDNSVHNLGGGYRGYIKHTKRSGWVARLATGGFYDGREVDKRFDLPDRDAALAWLEERAAEEREAQR
jgi:recombinational DNA repair protein RecT